VISARPAGGVDDTPNISCTRPFSMHRRRQDVFRCRDVVRVPTRPHLGLCVVRQTVATAMQICGKPMYWIRSVEMERSLILAGDEMELIRQGRA
jgi:hypothetical protein